jgi:hypothetical protein
VPTDCQQDSDASGGGSGREGHRRLRALIWGFGEEEAHWRGVIYRAGAQSISDGGARPDKMSPAPAWRSERGLGPARSSQRWRCAVPQADAVATHEVLTLEGNSSGRGSPVVVVVGTQVRERWGVGAELMEGSTTLGHGWRWLAMASCLDGRILSSGFASTPCTARW